MKAIFLTKYGNSDKAFEMRDAPEPVLEAGQIKIKVSHSGLNFADVVARRGLYPEAPKNPAVLGYDVTGVIVELDKAVKGFKIGDRVTALSRFGGYAEFVTTMQEGVAKLPDDIDSDIATALATQACTAYYCFESANLFPGDKVLIQAAAGGVGSVLVQLCKSINCEVYATASAGKHDYLRTIGADHCIDYNSIDFYKYIKDNTNGKGIDAVFDSIGGKAFSKGWKALRPTGKMINFGAAAQISGNKTNKLKALPVVLGFGVYSPIALLMTSKSMIGVNMLKVADEKPQVFKHCLEQVIKLTNDGVIKPALSKVFDVSQVAEAHDYLESRKSIGKVVLKWS